MATHPGCTTPADSLQWVANFTDGTELKECDGDQCHVFGEIDLNRLEAFGFVSANSAVVYAVQQTASTRVIFFRRSQMELNTGEPWRLVNVIGLKVTVGDRVAKVYQFVMPDGSTLLSTDLNAV